MGANAVVHRVQLHKVKEPTDEDGSARPTKQQRLSCRALSAEAVGSVLQRVELFSSLSPGLARVRVGVRIRVRVTNPNPNPNPYPDPNLFSSLVSRDHERGGAAAGARHRGGRADRRPG